MADAEDNSPSKGVFGSASMNTVRSFLKGRGLPGTVRMIRTEKAGAAAGLASPQQKAAALPPRPETASSVAAAPAAAQDGSSSARPDSTAQPSSPPVSRTNSSASLAAREASAGRAASTDGGGNIGSAHGGGSGRASPAIAGPLTEGTGVAAAVAAAPEAPAEATAAAAATAAAPKAPESRSMYAARVEKFQRLLAERVVDLEVLRELAWSGCPPTLRADCWRLLLGYLPPSHDRRKSMLARKRREYRDYLPQFYDVAPSERTEDETNALRQVAVDVPRTAPDVAFFHSPPLQKSLERILYIWGVRHPASGYVQGINDLVTPFLAVFLGEHFLRDGPMQEWDLEALSEEAMLEVEADSYWCLCKLLDGIQDHYTYAQPGIQRTVFHLKELVRRIDEPVARHLDDENVDFLQFSFRWINCLLIREVPFAQAARLWDTYLAEGGRLKDFLIYVAAAFLLSWSGPLRTMDFQEIVLFLQKPSTTEWAEADIESMLAQAYMWRASFGDARSHLAER